jgi:S1-C subfamily serine protease
MSLTQAINRISPSIVQICAQALELSRELQQRVGSPFIYKVLGTGFFVNSDAYIITARHVIQKGRVFIERINAARRDMFVSLGLPNSENFVGNRVLVDFDLVDEDANYDLALLRLRRNPFQGEVRSGIRIGENEIPIPAEVAQLNPDRPEEGQWVGISGYPFEERVLVTNSGYVASVWTIPNYLVDVEVNPGNSGGPVYLVEDASVIGVCIAIRGSPIRRENGEVARVLDQELYYSSGLTDVVPTRRIIEILDRNGVNYSLVSR